jgi:hypothetical protein
MAHTRSCGISVCMSGTHQTACISWQGGRRGRHNPRFAHVAFSAARAPLPAVASVDTASKKGPFGGSPQALHMQLLNVTNPSSLKVLRFPRIFGLTTSGFWCAGSILALVAQLETKPRRASAPILGCPAASLSVRGDKIFDRDTSAVVPAARATVLGIASEELHGSLRVYATYCCKGCCTQQVRTFVDAYTGPELSLHASLRVYY